MNSESFLVAEKEEKLLFDDGERECLITLSALWFLCHRCCVYTCEASQQSVDSKYTQYGSGN